MAIDRDPEELDPTEMIAYLRGAIRSSLRLLGVDVDDDLIEEPEYPTHAEQVRAWHDETGMRSGW